MTLRSGPRLLAASFRRALVHSKAFLTRRGSSRKVSVSPRGGPSHPAFTLDQLSTLLAWGRSPPSGCSLDVVADRGGFSEVAVVFRHKDMQERYLVYPTGHGTVVLVERPSARWELPTLEAALAKVLRLEQNSVGA